MLVIRGAAALVVIGLVIGAWQVAYARGKDEGRVEGAAIRTEFILARQPGAAGTEAAGAATKPGGGGTGGGGTGATKTGGGGGDAGGSVAKPGAGGRPGVNGTIEKVEADAVTVTTTEGSVRVTVSDQTRIGKQVQVPVADLKAGERVVASGSARATTSTLPAPSRSSQPVSDAASRQCGRHDHGDRI
jgi:hypothetical protein